MKAFLRKTALIMVISVFSAGIGSMLTLHFQKNEKWPGKIFVREISPNGSIEALVFKLESEKFFNLLGGDTRFYFGFRRNNISMIIDFDLSEGTGTYEGGVTGLAWLNDDVVMIKRFVNDQEKDIGFNFVQYKWIEGGDLDQIK